MYSEIRFWKKAISYLFVLAIVLIAQQACNAQDNLPFDVFGKAINNRQVYTHLELQATKLVENQADGVVEEFRENLRSADRTSKIKLTSLANAGTAAKENLYRHMVKSSLYLGELYDCGHCDRTHAGFSGGVLVSEDGLALTNYHVVQGHHKERTEGFMAMTYDGKCYAIDEVVAADKTADIALVRLKADGQKFHAAPIALNRPDPMDPVRIISNPHGQFFVLTEGEVSRYIQMTGQIFMEITADFGGGSSGSGIFNDRGEVIGIVSRIYPVIRKSGTKTPYVEMLLKRCVPLEEVHNCFEHQDYSGTVTSD